nr:alpha/beta fold hydrolase [uncultured Rhodopila sp.]
MMRWVYLLIIALLVACGAPRHTRPGDVLQVEAFPGAPDNAVASRMLYASTAPDGTSIVVSALVIVPAAAPAAGGRPVLAWLHPTTGVAPGCAPSSGPGPFAQIQGLAAFLAAGYVVVATDYPGLGGPGVHPYLVGNSEARAALDSVRATRNLAGAHASNRFAVWGHSQGGHAALFTAAIAARYSPDLQLVGAAAAAPVTDVAALIERPADDPLWGGLLSYAVWSWTRAFGLDPNMIVPPSTEAAISATAKDCLESGRDLARLLADSAPLRGTPVTPNAQWRKLLTENAAQPGPPAVPVFIAQGDKDPVIVPSLTNDFVRRLCRERVPVRYLMMPGVDHYTAGVRSAAAAAAWIADRFADGTPANDCLSGGVAAQNDR